MCLAQLYTPARQLDISLVSQTTVWLAEEHGHGQSLRKLQKFIEVEMDNVGIGAPHCQRKMGMERKLIDVECPGE